MACCVVCDGSKSSVLRLAHPIPAMGHDEQSLAAIAADSAAASRAWVHERLGRADFQLSCVCPCACACMHVLACVALYLLMPVRTTIAFLSTRYDGPAEICHRLAQKTKLRFTWHLTAEGINETCDVQVLLHNAVRRGVHLPQAWKSKWALGAEVLSFDALAHEAIQRARDEFSLPNDVKLDCRPSQTKTRVYTHICTHLSYA